MNPVNTDIITSLPKWRLHAIRALFLLNFLSLFLDNWKNILFPASQIDPMTGVAISFYAAFSLLCIVGIRYPLKFLPLVFLQLIYKIAWLIGVYYPAYAQNSVDENLTSWFWVMGPGILIDTVIIPWHYAYKQYVKGFFRFKRVISADQAES